MKHGHPQTSRSKGYATIAIIILLMAASAFLTASTLAFRNLHRELRWVDEKQRSYWKGVVVTPRESSIPSDANANVITNAPSISP